MSFDLGNIVGSVVKAVLPNVVAADFPDEPGGLQHEGTHQASLASLPSGPTGPVAPETQQTDTAARRITNARVNATALGGGSAAGATPVVASLTSYIPLGGLHPVANDVLFHELVHAEHP